jgi:hypothetical protein
MAFYATVALSNLTDVLWSFGLVDLAWRSGNVAWVRSALGFAGKPQWLALVVVCGATLVQALVAFLYLRAAARVAWRAPGAIEAFRAATVPGIALWFGFTVGVELFLAFETVDWSKFLALIVGGLVSLIVAERDRKSVV